MSDTVVDSIKIEVEGDSQKAVSSIDKLISSLERIENAVNGGNKGLGSLQKRLDKISASVNGIDTKGIGKLRELTEGINSLNGIGDINIGKNADKITQISSAVDMLKNADLDKLTDLTSALQGLSRVENVNIPAVSTPSIPDLEIPQIPAFDEKIDMPNEAAAETKALNAELKETAALFDKLDEKLENLGNTSNKTREKANANLKKVESSFSKFMGFVKRMIQFYIVYSGINVVTNGFNEGLANAYQYSKALGGSLASSLDRIATSANYLKNSLGAAAAPLIELFAPAIDWVTDKFVDLLNIANRVFAFLAGKSTWTKAIKVQTEYAEAVEGVVDANKDLKKTLLDIDEINALADNSTKALTDATANKNPTYAFEEVPLGDLQLPEIAAFSGLIIGGITAVWTTFKGTWDKVKKLKIVKAFADGFNLVKKNGGNTAKSLIGGIENVRNNLSWLQKGIITTASVFGEFMIVKNIFAEIQKSGKATVGQILEIGVVGGTAALALYTALGPAGLAVAGITALAAAFSGLHEDEVAYYEETLRKQYYEKQGAAIDDVREALNNYFKALNFDKQNEWIKKVNASEQAYKDARTAYDDMWNSISKKTTFDTSDIEGLTQAFNDLTNAATALNNAKISSLMESIKTGIELNITDKLNTKLGSLLDKLKEAEAVLGVQISGLNAEYQSILSEIQANGGVATKEQKNQLKALRDDLSKFTLSDDSSTSRWGIEINQALKQAINAGSDKDKVLANVKDLMSDRDTYLDALKSKWAEDENTIKQLIALDKSEFKGQLGFSETDLDALGKSYSAQVDAVNKKYNEVLEQIIKTYEEGMLKWGDYYFDDALYDGLTSLGVNMAGLFSADAAKWKSERELAAEQRELVDRLKGFRENGYKTGEKEVGTIVGKSAVVDAQVADSIASILEGNSSEQNAFLREQNELLRKILAKDTNVKAYVTTNDIVANLDRKNRRDGKTIVPVGLQ